MACYKRIKTGHCNHFQCPHSSETTHGYECVDVAGGFCEVGDDCLDYCKHSFGQDQDAEAMAAFKEKYGEDFGGLDQCLDEKMPNFMKGLL